MMLVLLGTSDPEMDALAQQAVVSEVQTHLVEYGVTQPIDSYTDSIKETIVVESTLHTDRDGQPDLIAADIMRPNETEEGLKVPVIMDASPYYESMCRGNESEVKDPN